MGPRASRARVPHEREARFLALVRHARPRRALSSRSAAFKGKSTVGLASVAMRYGLGPVITVDPHSGPSITDPTWDRGSSGTISASLRAAGVESAVEAHRAYSRDLAQAGPGRSGFSGSTATTPIAARRRISISFAASGLRCDRRATRRAPHVEGPVRVFAEELLDSDRFGRRAVRVDWLGAVSAE